MKKLEYKDFTKKYIVDFDRNEVHYREPLNGVRIYAHGEVQILRSGCRDLYWCMGLYKHTGLRSLMLDEFVGKQFCTPFGEEVPKARVKAGRLIYDPDRKVAYKLREWGSKLVFVGDNLGVPDDVIEVVVPQPKQKQELVAKYAECLALGDSLVAFSVDDNDRYWRNRHSLTGTTLQILKTKNVPVDLTRKDAQEFCLALAINKKKFLEWADKETQLVHKYEYLIVKEK